MPHTGEISSIENVVRPICERRDRAVLEVLTMADVQIAGTPERGKSDDENENGSKCSASTDHLRVSFRYGLLRVRVLSIRGYARQGFEYLPLRQRFQGVQSKGHGMFVDLEGAAGTARLTARRVTGQAPMMPSGPPMRREVAESARAATLISGYGLTRMTP